ncbi:Fasciclin domain-domain-containing protein [Coniella lustricola]|uniref:Fasciclin domain-domain-containing protein n=1 Tax=Coniella lustricola TaxID=2025994 RepID=A0A2T2ZS57_9PEZI|nr:Fasciclin domain-domain-containing protein [Coniella lustricola]
MKTATLLPFAALASGFVVPDVNILSELPVHEEQQVGHQQPRFDMPWLDWLPSSESLASAVHDVVETLSAGVEDAMNDIKGHFETEFDLLMHGNDDEDDVDEAHPPHHGGGGGHHHKKHAHETIYQLIGKSKYTTKFRALVDEHDDIVELLNSTKADTKLTLFVPVDSAFEHIPKDHKPSREFVEAVLKYHIGLGLYPAKRVLVTHTLPTALDEPLLGDKPQRLRTSVGLLSGVRVNFYSKVIAVDIPATNGVIHAVKSILVPPPMVGRELTLLPSKFSTLLLAFDKTNFTSFVHGVKMTGCTVFAPDNAAFSRLGPAANAFLFNTERGLGYLKALLKYHIVPNEVVYSDSYYSTRDDDDDNDDGGDDDDNDDDKDGEKAELSKTEGPGGDVGHGHYHLDVPTLLDDKSISIDVSRFGGLTHIKLNGYIPLVVQDGVAKNGVIHIPGRVLIPPHRHGGHERAEQAVDGEMSVEELMERLADYVEDDTERAEPVTEEAAKKKQKQQKPVEIEL